MERASRRDGGDAELRRKIIVRTAALGAPGRPPGNHNGVDSHGSCAAVLVGHPAVQGLAGAHDSFVQRERADDAEKTRRGRRGIDSDDEIIASAEDTVAGGQSQYIRSGC